jgi:hypothetical protein
LLWGLGHAYLRRIKRGVVLFFLGLGIMIVVSFLVPYPFPIIVYLIYLGWLISDVFRIIKLENGRGIEYQPSNSSISCQKCGSTNREDSSYCIKCGSPLR